MVIMHIIAIISIIIIITIVGIIVGFLEPVSVIAEAENRSNTRAYQTESGETTKAPLSIGVSNHQTIEQSKMPLALG